MKVFRQKSGSGKKINSGGGKWKILIDKVSPVCQLVPNDTLLITLFM